MAEKVLFFVVLTWIPIANPNTGLTNLGAKHYSLKNSFFVQPWLSILAIFLYNDWLTLGFTSSVK